MLQTAFGASCMNGASVFEWHKRFKEDRESVWDDERYGRSKEVNTPELIGQRVTVRVTMLRFLREFRKRFLGKSLALFKSGQWHFHQDNAPVHNSIWGDERGCDDGHWHAHTRGLPWGLPEIVGTIEQVHCSRRRLLRRGLEFHVCTINKSAHTKKVWKLI